MKKCEKKATLKISWTNAVIGVFLIVLISAGTRFGVWYGLMWMGDPEIFWTEFAELSVKILMPSLFLPVITYLLAYSRYKSLAAHHPAELHGVAKGVYGRHSLKLGIMLMVLEGLVFTVIGIAVKLYFKIDMSYNADKIAFLTLLEIAAGCAALNLILYIMAIRFLKPDWVQRS